MQRSRFLLLFIPLFLGACAQPSGRTGDGDSRPQLFEGMGSHHRQVTTHSHLAQRFFDQGLVWLYGFNYDEASRSFLEAARLDPDCAMAWWGAAMANGPHINNPIVTEPKARAGWEATQKAIRLRDRTSPVEQALIDALARRFLWPQPADRRSLDEAYAARMGVAWKANASDPDVGTLYAESLMDLQPWDLWAKDGSPKGRTEEILAVLDAVLELTPRHPGANHLYIHAVEASPHPERGMPSADRLRQAVPISSHLVHMPSHIDVQVGRWAAAVEQNLRAVEADRQYVALAPRQDFYRLYKAHNRHFLAFAAMMEGRSKIALQAAREMIASIPDDWLRQNAAFIDGYMSIVLDVQKRFGLWEDVLAAPMPPPHLPITTAMWRHSRAIAFAAKGDLNRAESEQASFRAATQRVPEEALMDVNPARRVLDVADHMLAGEIAYRQGRIDEAVAKLRRAVELEGQLLYMEPPSWIQPVRHTLGAILVNAKRWSDAEAVYLEDLEAWPENAWSLLGLSQCLRARADPKAAEVERRSRVAWARADVQPRTSCLCVRFRED